MVLGIRPTGASRGWRRSTGVDSVKTAMVAGAGAWGTIHSCGANRKRLRTARAPLAPLGNSTVRFLSHAEVPLVWLIRNVKILALCGSSRKGSLNQKLL